MKKTLSIVGTIIASLACFLMMSVGIKVLITGKAQDASFPLSVSSIVGYFILRPGKKQAKIEVGGVVVEVTAEDTGAFNTISKTAGVVASSVSQEISEKTRLAAMKTT